MKSEQQVGLGWREAGTGGSEIHRCHCHGCWVELEASAPGHLLRNKIKSMAVIAWLVIVGTGIGL